MDADGRWVARANGINLLGGALAPFIAGSIIASSDYKTLGEFCFFVALCCFMLAFIFNKKINYVNQVSRQGDSFG